MIYDSTTWRRYDKTRQDKEEKEAENGQTETETETDGHRAREVAARITGSP